MTILLIVIFTNMSILSLSGILTTTAQIAMLDAQIDASRGAAGKVKR